jgi:hypothetical protein
MSSCGPDRLTVPAAEQAADRRAIHGEGGKSAGRVLLEVGKGQTGSPVRVAELIRAGSPGLGMAGGITPACGLKDTARPAGFSSACRVLISLPGSHQPAGFSAPSGGGGSAADTGPVETAVDVEEQGEPIVDVVPRHHG